MEALSVFQDMERTDSRPIRAGETTYLFLQRIPGQFWDRSRALLEEWFARCDPNEQGDLLNRLRGDDVQFKSAFWELYVGELFRALGCEVERHPELPGTTRRPDFRMHTAAGSFLVEAVASTEDIHDPARNRDRDDLLVQMINDEVKRRDLWVNLSIARTGPSVLSKRSVIGRINCWMEALPLDDHFDGWPSLHFDERGWDFELTAHPVEGEPLDPQDRVVSGPVIAGSIDDRGRLRAMLDNKRRRYGHPHEPFLIAAAVDSPGFDADDVEQVLYGLVVMQYYVNFPDAPAPEPPRWVRQRDGVWCGPKGPRAGRVSGVLAMRTVQPWTVLRHSPRLWLNPSAEHPLPSDFGLPLGRLGDGRNPQTIDRPLDLANLLGLPSDWPGPEPAYESRVVDEAESESGE